MIRPVSPIGPLIWDLGAKAPIASPTNSTAPTPSENPPMLIWPTRYPTPIARNIARIGCEPIMSRARSNMTASPNLDPVPKSIPSSADAAARVFELCVYACDQLRRWRQRLLMLVGQVHCLPFEGAHLVQRLDFNPLDVFHRRDKLRDFLDILRIVCQARHQGETDPGPLAHCRQPLGKPQSRRELPSGRSAVRVGIAAFDIEDDHVEQRKEFIVGPVSKKS